MELKHSYDKDDMPERYRSNCTFMELKHTNAERA